MTTEKAASYTPGPWQLTPHGNDDSSLFEDDGECKVIDISGPDGKWAAFAHAYVRCGGEEDEEGLANARLIAAAPELLQALEYCHAFGSQGTVEGGEHDGMSVSYFVENALKKARGA